jgi:tRNA-guanine family transglycosylase
MDSGGYQVYSLSKLKDPGRGVFSSISTGWQHLFTLNPDEIQLQIGADLIMA